MKSLKEVQNEVWDDFKGGDVFTVEEFEELMKPTGDPDCDSEIEFVDSYGYFHDGENVTDVEVDPYTFRMYKDIYPYVVWHKV